MNWRGTISWIAVMALTVLGVVYARRHWDELTRMQVTHASQMGWVAGFMALRISLRGFFQWQVMRGLGCSIPVTEAMALNYAGTMMNMVLPMPFAPAFRATYLKRRHDFPFSSFASTLAALFVYFLAVACLLGLVAVAWLSWRDHPVPFRIWWILPVVLAGCAATRWLPRQIALPGSLGERLDRILQGWQTLHADRRLVATATLVVCVSMIAGVAALLAAFRAFDLHIGVPGSLLLLSSQQVGALIKLTPGAIGFQEMVSVYFASALPVTTAQTVVVLALTRLINILVALVLGLPCLFWLARAPGSER